MEATIKIKLEPFTVPNFVLTSRNTSNAGLPETPKYALAELDEMTLDALCREFYREVFRKAGKTPPPTDGHPLNKG